MLDRFKEVAIQDSLIDQRFHSFPCMSTDSNQPEPEEATVDFELIVKQLEDQEREK